MTRLRHALRWLAPFRALWLRERDDHAATRSDLAVVTADRDALRSHYELAVEQRDRARDLAVGLVDDLPAEAWDATDDAILCAWLHGEGGPA